MAKISRKELKSDHFAMEVEHTVDYVAHHKTQIARYAGVGGAVAVAALAAYLYISGQRTARMQALGEAVQVLETPVGAAQSGGPSFPTQDARDKEAVKLFTNLASKHAGSTEGVAARYYLATLTLDQGKTAEAEKMLKEVVDSGGKEYASLAQLSLAELQANAGRAADAEKILRNLADHPTILVSKEQATISLARVLGKSKPDEARKLLEPLAKERSSISRNAVTALGELAPK